MDTMSRMSKAPAVKDSNIVKIAVEMVGQSPKLAELNQKQPLSVFIEDLCSYWNISEPEQYALKFNMEGNKNFVSEKNRADIKNGCVLQLGLSASKISQNVLKLLAQSQPEERARGSAELAQLCGDPCFAQEFVERKGLDLVISLIEGAKVADQTTANLLPALVEIMEHGIAQWDVLEPPFINRTAGLINNQSSPLDPRTLQAALSILENLVHNSANYPLVEKELTIPNLAMHLQNPSQPIQLNALALINALFLKANDSKRSAIASTLNVRQIRNSIVTNIIQGSAGQMGNEMAHQLHVMQTLMLSVLEEKANTALQPDDEVAMEKIRELRKIAFDSDGSDIKDVTARKSQPKDFRKLGFKNDANPLADLAKAPPGSLALDAMLYFASNQMDKYTRVVLENSGRGDEYDCPFARAAIELTRLLVEILKIGDQPSEQGTTFHPMFFNHDHPFEELFCVCLLVVNKTWKEMRATVEDLDKVFSVVREQITRALASLPGSLEAFKSKIGQLTYAEITELWQQERTSREKWESRSRPIMELREQIQPEMIELIQQQRLGYLTEGTRFNKYSNRGRVKDKFLYVRLSPNHRVIHYADCDEKSVPALDELSNKLSVADIRALVTGKDCPHMKDARGKKTMSLYAFSLMLDSNDVASLDLVASDQQTFDYWIDGINALLGNKMNSKEAANDLEVLLAMDIKLRLLDVEGMDLPEEPPSVPPPPSNYDFAIETK